MKKITINLSFFNQDKILRDHVKGWISWPEELSNYYSFCIVDDFSKNDAISVLEGIDISKIDLSIYRVKEDLYCNIAGVRNLSAKYCKTEWMVILDMDTMVSEKLSKNFLDLTNSLPGNCFKFNRRVLKNPFHIKNGKQATLTAVRPPGRYGVLKFGSKNLIKNLSYQKIVCADLK